jgi:hypothetical protein
MIKLYKYFYYRLYSWNMKSWGKNDFPHINALFGVSFMMFLNLLALVEFFRILFDLDIFMDKIHNAKIIIISIILLIINYFWLVYNGKYKLLLKIYQDETRQKRNFNAIRLWIYTLISFIVLIVLAIIS